LEAINMTDKETSLKNILGLNQPRTTAQTVSSIIGGALFGAGFLGSIKANDQIKTYTQATKDIQSRIGEIGPSFSAKAESESKALAADLAGYQAGVESGIESGLQARGITDKGIAESSKAQVRGSLSGAYAAARSALSRAKVNASMGLSGSLSAYQQALAQKQYESQVSKYYSKMGLWGALGGMGAGLIDTESTPGKKERRNRNEL
jgi:hypothetical protein